MNSSFSKAKTDAFIWIDDIIDGPNTAGSWDILVEWIRKFYIYNVYTNDSLGPHCPMYLFGIMDQHPRDTAYIGSNALAITFPSGYIGSDFPGCYGGVSVIFSGYTKIVAGSTWGWDEETIEHAFEEIVIHEFGHQRANLPHYDHQDPDPHTPGSKCVMAGGIRDEFDNFLGWYDFCDYCIGQIEEQTWGKRKKEVQNVKQ